MYAAAGGASIASRQARRNIKKQHLTGDQVHQKFQKRFNQLHQQHAPASNEHFLRQSEQPARQSEQGQYGAVRFHHLDHEAHLLRTAPAGLSSRLPSYVDLNGRITGFGSCDVSEGKAATAWSERERRPSAVECASNHRVRATEAHGRWMKRNRIHDSSFGGSSSEDEDFPGGLYGHQSAAANALLYVGLGTVAIGLVIAFVGTGEKGFKTLELRLIGPTLIGSGVLCCLVRIFLCVCPTQCLRRRFRHRHRRKRHTAGAELNRHGFQSDKATDYYKHLPYNRTAEDFMLIDQPGVSKKNKKRVSIIPAGQTMQNPKNIPQINVPSSVNSSDKDENLIELSRLGNSLDDLHSLSSEDSFNESLILVEGNKLSCVNSAERLARLKSTLTFDDSSDLHECLGGVTRIDEEDSETMDNYDGPGPTSPMLTTSLAVEPSHVQVKRELVLSPAKLQNSDE